MSPRKTILLLNLEQFFPKKNSSRQKDKIALKVGANKISTTHKLQKSLKQLEFISLFEMNLDKHSEHLYSLSFLQELEQLKYSAQLDTIELLSLKSA
ncbi:hypothetical protein [Psychroserpens sp. Hel_I_66]|uniref:hypothetical protein n=1 Tax=Psychroserpens sp. Hel_I_66 TaxID=1250004 RepID=UPI000646CCF2|nr:hypothetical protein [Psychroserpens sp. Hel_I_66]